MAIAYIIGNGPSRKQIALEKLDGVTFGCNALYRDFSPDYLIGGDATIIKEICASGYPNDNQCIFPDWDPIPKTYMDTLLQPFKDQNYRIEESDLDKHDHIQIFGLSEDPAEDMQVHVLGVDINWNIINMRGTDDDPGFSVNFFTGAQAMAQAAIMGYTKIGLIGFDSIWNFIPDTYQNIYAGTNAYDNVKETARLRVGSDNPNSLIGTQEAQIKKVLDRFEECEYTIYYSGNKNPMGEALWAPLKYNSFIK